MPRKHNVIIRSQSNEKPDLSICGNAEITLDGRECVVSWGAGSPLLGSFYDDWLDLTDSQNKEVEKALFV